MALRLLLRSGIYYVRGTVRGKSVYETTGTDDKKAAEAIRAKRETQLLEESIHGRQATVTFAEAASSYLDSGGSPRFLGTYDVRTKRWSGLIGHFGSRKLGTITQSDLDKAADKLYPGTQHSTRNRQCHAPFIAVWNHAYRNKWCELRMWQRPRKPKGIRAIGLAIVKRSGTGPVSYEHGAKFIGAMSPAPAMLMTVLFYTGMRPSEAMTLEAAQVNIPGRWITLTLSKTGEPRGVPMHEVLVPLFSGLYKQTGPLLRTPRGEPYPIHDHMGGQLKTAINGARKRSGIRDVSPYTARHTVSTQLVINGIHHHIKDQILGHAVDDMSRHYTNVPQAPLIEAINTLPTIDEWANAEWMADPMTWRRKLAAGTGKRNDLIRKRA